MIFIFIYSLKYINIFLIVYMKCARKFFVLQCAMNQKSMRTSSVVYDSFQERIVS
jgi:hypothetical protein